MNNVPNMISGKDLHYITDMLNWNLIALKKARHYLSHIKDEDVKMAVQKSYDLHKKHYMFLLNLLG